MGKFSILAMAGTKRDLIQACQFPPDVQWDKIVRVEIPDDYGDFPSTEGYTAKNFQSLESDKEDSQLHPYMQKCVDSVLDYVTKNSERLGMLNFRNIRSTVVGMNEGGPVFAVAAFVSYEPML